MKRSFIFLIAFLGLVHCPLTAQSSKRMLTLQDVDHPASIVPPGINSIQWSPDSKRLSYVRPVPGSPDGAALVLYDVETHRATAIINPAERKEKLDLGSQQWSPRGDSILLLGENDLWLFELQSGRLRRLTSDGVEKEVPTFAPSGKRIAFVKQHNLCVLDVSSGTVRELTHDGSDTVYNGRLDWVYEEELANRSTARSYEWSPDSKRIAFLRLDDSDVPIYPITEYLPTHVTLTREHFPQAGDRNPTPSLRVVEVDNATTNPVSFALSRENAEYFGPTFTWTPDGKAVCLLTLNRAQTEVAVRRWEPGARDRILFTERDAAWVNSLEPPLYVNNGREFLWPSERDGWQHLYLYSADGTLERQLTHGNWMLDRPVFQDAPLFQMDAKNNWVYFASTNPDARERQLYRIHLDGSGMERLTTAPGSHTLDLSPDGRFMVDQFSTHNTPPMTRLLNASGALAATIDAPSNHLEEFALGKREDVELKSKDGSVLYAQIIKPPDFDPSRKYPVIVDVYGGPHVQLIEDRWDSKSLYEQLLATNGFIVWTLDNRGSWGRGHTFESVILKNMGTHELEDQLTGVEYLKTLPYVDASRIGIRGWSYGGYMTLYALTHAPDVFKCGSAGAPVTDWKFYDSIYTERYMRTPAENPEGYKTSSPLEAAASLKAKVLILHGTSDDNVHMQNSIAFIYALIRAGKPYELHLQPGQKHGFGGDAAISARDQRILEFLKANLK